MKPLQARWFDGRSPQPRPCRLDRLPDGQLHLQPEAEGELARVYPAAQVQWPERTRHGRRQIVLPDGGTVDLPDAQAWDAWALAHGLAEPMAVRWAASWRMTLISGFLLLLTAVVMWRWVLPWGAEAATAVVPEALERRIGEQALNEVERLWLEPSKLAPEEQARIQARVARMAGAAYPEGPPSYRIHFRDGGKALGPNAFALPGGDIIITDALVQLLREPGESVSPALLGVVAHELGHVRHQHGLKMVFRTGATGALIGLWIGDYSTVLATIPTWLAQAGYSREAEREADDEALRVMREAGIDPRSMVVFFQRMQRELPERKGDDRMMGLASHPADSERIRLFETGQR